MVQRAIDSSSDPKSFRHVILARQSLKVLEELLQSSMGGQVATRLAGMHLHCDYAASYQCVRNLSLDRFVCLVTALGLTY